MPILKAVAEAAARQAANVVAREPPRSDEVTLRFRKFTPWRGTAYNAGTCAGFLIADARDLVRRGKADAIDPATGAVITLPAEAPRQGLEPDFTDNAPKPSHWAVPAAPHGPGHGLMSFFRRESDPA